MVVNLQPQGRVKDAQAPEDAEKVVITPEEDVKSHLDVVAVLVLPAAHLRRWSRSQGYSDQAFVGFAKYADELQLFWIDCG